MALPVVTTPATEDLLIQQGVTFGPYLFRWTDDDGHGIDLVTGGITAEASFVDDDGTALFTLTTGGGGLTIVTPQVVAPTAISAAFLADGVVVASGAQFITNGVRAKDRVTIAGSTSNDTTTARVVSVDSEDQITTDQTFTAEPAAGTVAVDSEGWFYLEMDTTQTAALTFTAGHWDCEFTDPSASPVVKRRPLRGRVTLEKNR